MNADINLENLENEDSEFVEYCEHFHEIDNQTEELTRSLKAVTLNPMTAVRQAPGHSTGVLKGLSLQIIDEINEIRPNFLVSFADLNVQNGDGVNPYLQPAAKQALKRAIAARGQTLKVNSALRTIAQQLMLWNHYVSKCPTCNIPIAAKPNRSNHLSGLALDVQEPQEWRPFLEAQGWRWYGSGDPWHFTYTGGNDIRSIAILAFQRLWNKHNPDDKIDEDGDFGPKTVLRLNKAPIGGFAVTSSSNRTSRILRLSEPHMQGEDVRKVQQALVKAKINVTVDGIFGPGTDKAVKQFQQQKGLTVDGIVGPTTLSKLGV